MSDHDLKKKRKLERELLQLTKKPQSITRVNKRKHDYLMKEVVDINKQAKAWKEWPTEDDLKKRKDDAKKNQK